MLVSAISIQVGMLLARQAPNANWRDAFDFATEPSVESTPLRSISAHQLVAKTATVNVPSIGTITASETFKTAAKKSLPNLKIKVESFSLRGEEQSSKFPIDGIRISDARINTKSKYPNRILVAWKFQSDTDFVIGSYLQDIVLNNKSIGSPMKLDPDQFRAKDENINVKKSGDRFEVLITLSESELKRGKTFLRIPSQHPVVPALTPLPKKLFDLPTQIGQISTYSFPNSFYEPPERSIYSVRSSFARTITFPNTWLFRSPDDEGLIYLNRFGSKVPLLTRLLKGSGTISFPLPIFHGEIGDVTITPKGEFIYVTYRKGEQPLATIVRLSLSGQVLAKTDLDLKESAFNVKYFGPPYFSILASSSNLMLLASRTMWNGHQGSFAALLDQRSLRVLRNFGQNSGHSFGHRIIDDLGVFSTVDVGDNYPRGLVINRFYGQSKVTRTVFTYRTDHRPFNDKPHYDGKGNLLEPMKWSNDNHCYTELGAIRSTQSGLGLVFSSERSTNNSTTTSEYNESRNIGLVLVARSIERFKQEDYVVPSGLILSKGNDSLPFGFYDYGGQFKRQQNRGVVWLTNYSKKTEETAVCPRAVTISRDRLLILWEKWSVQGFRDSWGMIVDESGRKIVEPFSIGNRVTFSNASEPTLLDDEIVWATQKGERTLIFRWKLRANGSGVSSIE